MLHNNSLLQNMNKNLQGALDNIRTPKFDSRSIGSNNKAIDNTGFVRRSERGTNSAPIFF